VWCWVNPLPFGTQIARLLTVDTAVMVVGNEAWRAVDGGAPERFDAGGPVSGLATLTPDEVWWKTANGDIRFQGTTRTFIPGPPGPVMRGAEPGSFWIPEGASSYFHTDGVGWTPVPFSSCFIQRLAGVSRTTAVAMCDALPNLDFYLLSPSFAPSLFFSWDGGGSPQSSLVARSTDELIFNTGDGPGMTGSSYQLRLDGGLSLIGAFGGTNLTLSSDGTVFASQQGNVFKLVGNTWSLFATASAIDNGVPLDMVGDAVLYASSSSFGIARGGMTRPLTTQLMTAPCTGLTRGPHVQFVCGTRRFASFSGPVVAVPGSVTGTPLALDPDGNLWAVSGSTLTRTSLTGVSANFSLPPSLSSVRLAVTDARDMFVVAVEAGLGVVFFKPSTGSVFSRLPVTLGAVGFLGLRDAEAFGSGALATVGNRLFALAADGGLTTLLALDGGVETGGGTLVSDVCVVSPDEYYVGTLYASRLFVGTDAGLVRSSVGGASVACAPGRALSYGGIIGPITGPSTTWSSPISPDVVLMRDDGATWVMSTGGQVVFRQPW